MELSSHMRLIKLSAVSFKKPFLYTHNVEDILFGDGEIKLKKAHLLIYFSLMSTLYHKTKILKYRNECSIWTKKLGFLITVSILETVLKIGLEISIYFFNIGTLSLEKSCWMQVVSTIW